MVIIQLYGRSTWMSSCSLWWWVSCDVLFICLFIYNLGVGRDRWRALVSAVMNLRVPLNAENFLTSSASQEGLCSMDPLAVKRQRYETDHSPLSSAEIKNTWSSISIHPCNFMLWCRTTLSFLSSFNDSLNFLSYAESNDKLTAEQRIWKKEY